MFPASYTKITSEKKLLYIGMLRRNQPTTLYHVTPPSLFLSLFSPLFSFSSLLHVFLSFPLSPLPFSTSFHFFYFLSHLSSFLTRSPSPSLFPPPSHPSTLSPSLSLRLIFHDLFPFSLLFRPSSISLYLISIFCSFFPSFSPSLPLPLFRSYYLS